MNKKIILDLFKTQLENELQLLEAQIKQTRDEATHEESKPENEYDTRALETGYLVKAQSKRLLDAKETLAVFKHAVVKDYTVNDPIGPTALVEVNIQNKPTLFLFMPSGGGVTVEYNQRKIQVMTATSPMGEALVGLKQGDFISLEGKNGLQEYEILKVW